MTKATENEINTPPTLDIYGMICNGSHFAPIAKDGEILVVENRVPLLNELAVMYFKGQPNETAHLGFIASPVVMFPVSEGSNVVQILRVANMLPDSTVNVDLARLSALHTVTGTQSPDGEIIPLEEWDGPTTNNPNQAKTKAA